MRGAFVAVLAVAMSVATATDKKYESKEGKYTVTFPEGAEVKTQTQDAGMMKIQIAAAQAKDKMHIVMYFDMPDAVKAVPAKQLLDGAQKGAVDKSGGKLDKATEIEFGPNKLPGRDLLLDKDGNKVRTLLILDGTRVYMAMVGGPKDYATTKEAKAFVDSFEIGKK